MLEDTRLLLGKVLTDADVEGPESAADVHDLAFPALHLVDTSLDVADGAV